MCSAANLILSPTSKPRKFSPLPPLTASSSKTPPRAFAPAKPRAPASSHCAPPRPTSNLSSPTPTGSPTISPHSASPRQIATAPSISSSPNGDSPDVIDGLAMTRKLGVGLVVTAYAALLYTSLAAPAYARAHPHLGAATLAEYAGPWPVALACSLSNMDVACSVHSPAGHANGLRSPLPSRARSAPAWLPYLYDRGVARRDRAAARLL